MSWRTHRTTRSLSVTEVKMSWEMVRRHVRDLFVKLNLSLGVLFAEGTIEYIEGSIKADCLGFMEAISISNRWVERPFDLRRAIWPISVQRRIMVSRHIRIRKLSSIVVQNPTFGPAAIKALVPVFLNKSYQVNTHLLRVLLDWTTFSLCSSWMVGSSNFPTRAARLRLLKSLRTSVEWR